MAEKHKIIAFVLAESPRLESGDIVVPQPAKSAPKYFAESLPKQSIVKQERRSIDGHAITIVLKAYASGVGVVLAEATAEIDNVFSDASFALRKTMIDLCYETLKQNGNKTGPSEEYAIAIVSGYTGDPEQFFKHQEKMTCFLKSEHLALDEKEIEYTLSSQIKYSNNDLVIVDWDGAFIFDPEGDIESIVELIETANLQLLRCRILDSDLDRRLQRMAVLLQKTTKRRFFVLRARRLAEQFRKVIALRSRSLVEFEALDRDIKLIGDWYSARLYELTLKKFRTDGWIKTVKEKLDSIEDMYSIIAENFSVSTSHMLEMIQIILFFVLQVGWFVLIIMELQYFSGK